MVVRPALLAPGRAQSTFILPAPKGRRSIARVIKEVVDFTKKDGDGVETPAAFAKHRLMEKKKEMQHRPAEDQTGASKNFRFCPECGEPVEHEGGCVVCRNCGYSKCG